MEINTNPNYLNNVQNQNAQGANSATAENVVEENLFDGNEANATQNNAASQDYQNAEMLNTFVAAFTAVMAPFMQMMTQFMTAMTANLTAEDNANPQAKATQNSNNYGFEQIVEPPQNEKNQVMQQQTSTQIQETNKSEFEPVVELPQKTEEKRSWDAEVRGEGPSYKDNILEALKNRHILQEWFDREDNNGDGIINLDDGTAQSHPLNDMDISKYKAYLEGLVQ